MALAKITEVRGRAVHVPGDDIDTDRIIPARFMKCVTFDGLGEFLFYDVRKNADGSDKPHPLNDPKHAGATVLVSGANFGCGSSREHAPQAIYRYGFRGVVAESFAEIFFGNCTTLGIPCFSVSRADREALAALLAADPQAEVTMDVEKLEVRCAGKTFKASLRDSAHKGLVTGQWDPIGELLEGAPQIAKVASGLAYV
ncbi:3-isopropylmalate dehydratase small subunit [Opitutales bacterium ASA1]|uniref:3-isopropylmalate dehydratase small subunit n=1 Tax=Congregicoccus parvus TaxID=3081749 RepID=UPI002B2B7273|nr:3-isopropylmalate dehydratase small subunit [Opitutales bacterium ASA1]